MRHPASFSVPIGMLILACAVFAADPDSERGIRVLREEATANSEIQKGMETIHRDLASLSEEIAMSGVLAEKDTGTMGEIQSNMEQAIHQHLPSAVDLISRAASAGGPSPADLSQAADEQRQALHSIEEARKQVRLKVDRARLLSAISALRAQQESLQKQTVAALSLSLQGQTATGTEAMEEGEQKIADQIDQLVAELADQDDSVISKDVLRALAEQARQAAGALDRQTFADASRTEGAIVKKLAELEDKLNEETKGARDTDSAMKQALMQMIEELKKQNDTLSNLAATDADLNSLSQNEEFNKALGEQQQLANKAQELAKATPAGNSQQAMQQAQQSLQQAQQSMQQQGNLDAAAQANEAAQQSLQQAMDQLAAEEPAAEEPVPESPQQEAKELAQQQQALAQEQQALAQQQAQQQAQDGAQPQGGAQQAQQQGGQQQAQAGGQPQGGQQAQEAGAQQQGQGQQPTGGLSQQMSQMAEGMGQMAQQMQGGDVTPALAQQMQNMADQLSGASQSLQKGSSPLSPKEKELSEKQAALAKKAGEIAAAMDSQQDASQEDAQEGGQNSSQKGQQGGQKGQKGAGKGSGKMAGQKSGGPGPGQGSGKGSQPGGSGSGTSASPSSRGTGNKSSANSFQLGEKSEDGGWLRTLDQGVQREVQQGSQDKTPSEFEELSQQYFKSLANAL